MRLAITYDISDDSIRRDVYNILESYGAWKQYSVFELEVTRTERAELEQKIKKQLEAGDRVRIYTLCQTCTGKIDTLGENQGDDGPASNVI